MFYKKFVHFILVVEFIGMVLLKMHYFPFNIFKICSDVNFLFLLVIYVSSFFFPCISLSRVLSFLLIFPKNQLLVSLTFLKIGFLDFTAFHSDLYYFPYSTYLGFNLLFFFYFLKMEDEVFGLKPFFSNIFI